MITGNLPFSNFSVKTDLTWYLNPKNTLKGGIEFTPHYSDPGTYRWAIRPNQAPAPEIAKYQSLEYDLYLSNDQKIGKRNHCSIRYPPPGMAKPGTNDGL